MKLVPLTPEEQAAEDQARAERKARWEQMVALSERASRGDRQALIDLLRLADEDEQAALSGPEEGDEHEQE